MITPSLRYVVTAVLAAIFMGTTGAVAVLSETTAEVVTFYRLGFGAALLVVFLLVTGRWRQLAIWPGYPVLLTGALLAGFILLYLFAIQYTPMVNAIMLLYLAPLGAALYAHVFLQERLGTSSLLCIVLALVGFAMLLEFRLDLSWHSESGLGLFYALAGSLCYGAYIVVNRQLDPGIPVLTRSVFQMAVGALMILPFMVSTSPPSAAYQWFWLAIAGLIPGFLALVLAVIALKQLPAATYGTLAYLEPITVVLLAWILFDQSLQALQIAGCLLIITAGIGQAVLTHRRGRTTAPLRQD